MASTARGLITVAEYRAGVGKDDPGDDTSLADDIVAVSRIAETECKQFFWKDDEVQPRLFIPKWTDRLDLDYEGLCPGLATLEDVVIKVDTDGDGSFADETAWPSTDWRAYPLQAGDGPQPRPWNTIKTCGNGAFRPGVLTQVEGIWGWASVPLEVKALVGKWVRIWRMEGPEGTGRINELGTVVSVSIDVKRLLDKALDACTSNKVTF